MGSLLGHCGDIPGLLHLRVELEYNIYQVMTGTNLSLEQCQLVLSISSCWLLLVLSLLYLGQAGCWLQQLGAGLHCQAWLGGHGGGAGRLRLQGGGGGLVHIGDVQVGELLGKVGIFGLLGDADSLREGGANHW